MPNYIEQKLKSNCGQIALAALTDTPLEKVYEIVGHKRGTRTVAIVTALRVLGFFAPKRPQHWHKFAVDYRAKAFGIAILKKPGRAGWHWVAIANGLVYDGNRSEDMPVEAYIQYQAKAENARITSFLPVEDCRQQPPQGGWPTW